VGGGGVGVACCAAAGHAANAIANIAGNNIPVGSNGRMGM
jgi:hypothetical protein